jgi:hypothetical protein
VANIATRQSGPSFDTTALSPSFSALHATGDSMQGREVAGKELGARGRQKPIKPMTAKHPGETVQNAT